MHFESAAAIFTDDLQRNTALTKPDTDLCCNVEYAGTEKTIRFLNVSIAVPLQANSLYIVLNLHGHWTKITLKTLTCIHLQEIVCGQWADGDGEKGGGMTGWLATNYSETLFKKFLEK